MALRPLPSILSLRPSSSPLKPSFSYFHFQRRIVRERIVVIRRLADSASLKQLVGRNEPSLRPTCALPRKCAEKRTFGCRFPAILSGVFPLYALAKLLR